VNDTADTGRVRRGRVALIAIVRTFALPFIVASLMYKHYSGGAETTVSSNGELIWPAIPLESFSLRDARTQKSVNLEWLKQSWTLVYLSRGPCEKVCKQNIYHLRQIHVGLGKEAHRVQRLAVSGQPGHIEAFLGEQYPRLTLATGAENDLDGLYGQFDQAVREMPLRTESMYLVDPLGNLMMRFPSDLDPKGILKDLRRALRASGIG